MMQNLMNTPPGFRPTKSAPLSPAKPLCGRKLSESRSNSFNLSLMWPEPFHVTHKVPVGDTPYVRAKNVQVRKYLLGFSFTNCMSFIDIRRVLLVIELVDKDPERAIALFWAAINAGDRVDSALKDMAIVMKQQNRAEEAIEAIKSLRHRCSDQAQESLDNILLDLYKKCGRFDDQIRLLRHKLFLIQKGMAFNGKRKKTARSQGKKFQVSIQQEATRLLGNLGWALMQQNHYIEAEDAYRRALVIAPDNNKMCYLGICLMKQGRIGEAKDTLRLVKPAEMDGPRGVDSHLKAYERAQQMLRDLESEMMNTGSDSVEQKKLFDAFLGSAAIWQPQPCKEHNVSLPPLNPRKTQDGFANQNANSNIIANKSVMGEFRNSLDIGANPFNASNLVKVPPYMSEGLKRTRSGDTANMEASKIRRRSVSPEKNVDFTEFFPNRKDFEEAIIAAVLGSSSEPGNVVEKSQSGNVVEKKIKKRLKVFQDITSSVSPRA